MIHLPIDTILPDLIAACRKHRNVVLSAEPGAGKTTRVPLALLEEEWLAGKKIIMLEPRRLAAQRAAVYMAEQRGEETGETVGYRIRGESRIGRETRLEVVTEGVLTRLVQNDSALSDFGLIIFDEFHERSIHADLGLALTLNVQEHLRSDLHILIMSATLDRLAVASLLGDAPVVRSEGKAFPVTTRYLQHPHEGPLEQLVTSTIIRAMRDEPGDMLVFLPGQREIRRVESLLHEKDLPEECVIHMLFGEAPYKQQQDALMPAPHGKRKIILSTSIAETSLTIDGVRIVIDSGLARSSRFDSRRGMSGLVTSPVSQSSADQRRGRAGRQQPGICYRLWTEQQHAQIPMHAASEILVSDLASFALELALWGSPEGNDLHFLDPPPPAHLSHARELLTKLEAIDNKNMVTTHGRAMASLAIHPRFAHMLLRAADLQLGALACDVAALLEERNFLQKDNDREIDLYSRWDALRTGNDRRNPGGQRVMAQSERLRKLLGIKNTSHDGKNLGTLLALAYPERVAKRREKLGNRYQLAGGSGAVLPKQSLLSREEYLAIGDADGVGSEVKIYLAEPLTKGEIERAFPNQLTTATEVYWDDQHETVVAKETVRFGSLSLSEIEITPSEDLLCAMLLQGIRQMGIDVLPWNKPSNSLRIRSEWLRTNGFVENGWPDVSDMQLLKTLEEWLSPYVHGLRKRTQLQALEMGKILASHFTFAQLRQLDRMMPTHLVVPTGSRIPIEYDSGSQPILAVRLQEMFGQTTTPTICDGKVNVLIHLLSPAHRPIAITQDLQNFWKNVYPEVRKDMRGRYPKHSWPENPLDAKPTKRTKRAMK